jgi:ATP-dependent Lon protease
VGGIKEKVLAAHRIGIRQVVLPKRNERDAEDVPPEVRNEMQFHFVDTAEQVLAIALVPAGEPAGAGARGAADGGGRAMSAKARSGAARAPRGQRRA